MRPFAKAATLRGRLLLLVFVVAIALLTLAAIAVLEDYEGDRERAEEQLRDQATTLALRVDREFDRTEVALRILGTSVALAHGDLSTFEIRLRAASEALGGEPIALLAPDGSELLNTQWAPEEHRPGSQGSPTARRVFASGRPELSDLHWDPVAGRPDISVAVPVFSPGAASPSYALCLSLRREPFMRLLIEQASRQDWYGAVLDRRGDFVARTRRDTETVGQLAPAEVLEALGMAESGVLRDNHRTPEGVPSVAAFARSPVSGYAVVVSLPEETFLAPLREALRRTLGIGALIAVAGLLLALLLSWRILASLHALEQLGRGAGEASGAMPGGGMQEVDAIARVLADAARRQALLVGELNHRVKNTLATVQSVAAQTLRSSGGDVNRFTHDFGQRLQALAAAHNLLTTHAWGRTELASVVQAALAPWREPDSTVQRITFDGPGAITVTPRQAQAIVLALHELATNAVKYGALSRASGKVALRWAREEDDMVALRWTETGGPEITRPPEQRGFGSRLLERALAKDLGPDAAVELRFEPAGLRAGIRFSPGTDSKVTVPDARVEP